MALLSLSEYESQAERAHGHLCAGQILGVRLAMHGLRLLELDDPLGAHRKRLVTYVEIDRCATDAIGVVTGCRLGKRALKFADYGKMAATFCDLETGRAVRVAALESSKQRAAELFAHLEPRGRREMAAYRTLPDDELFAHNWVRVRLSEHDLPGYKGARVECAACGERVNFAREVTVDGRLLCRSCAGASYYEAEIHS